MIRRAQLVAVLASLDGAAVLLTDRTLAVDGAFWNVLAIDFHLGNAGSSMRGAHVLVGSSAYLYWLHTADTPTGSDATGYDPGHASLSAVFPELAGRTGYAVTLPAGNSTPAAHAVLVAAALATIPGVLSATPRAADTDGSVTIDVVTTGAALTTGARAWASRGAAGPLGSRSYRMPRSGDGPTVTSTNVTATIASAVTTPTANSIPWACSAPIGTTTSTASSARPRITWRLDATVDADPAGSSVLMDVGQIPASEIVAGTQGTIYFTPAQVYAGFSALNSIGSGRLWLSIHAAGGCHYMPFATSHAASAGEQVTQNMRTAAFSDPTSVAPGTFTTTASFGVWAGIQIHYEINPATSGERRVRLGSVASSASHLSLVALPDSYTAQGSVVGGTAGMRFRGLTMAIVSGTVRTAIMIGGDTTLPGVTAVGATVLADLGTNGVATGDVEYLAPTGASTVRMPAGGAWALFYGLAAVGRGEAGPSPFAVASTALPASHITIGGASNGNAEREQDIAQVGLGNAANAPITIPAGTLTVVDNCPFYQLELYSPALVAA